MTSVRLDQLPGVLPSQSTASKLPVGRQLTAEIVGPTRNGLVVRLGNETLVLSTASKLAAGAGTATVQIGALDTAADAASGRSVQVLALDDRPLPQPIAGELAPKAPPPSSKAAATADVVLRRQVEVTVRPLGAGDQVSGPSLVVRLSAQPAPGDTAGRPAAAGPAGPAGAGAAPVLASGSPQQAPLATPAPARAGPAPPPVQQVLVSSPTGPPFEPHVPAQAAAGEATAGLEDPMAVRAVGRTTGGQVVLQADGLRLLVDRPIDLPIGAALQMTLMAGSVVPGDRPEPAASPDRAGLLTKLITLLDSLDPAAGGGTGAADGTGAVIRLPRPDRTLGARLLHLIDLMDGPSTRPGAEIGDEPAGAAASGRGQIQGLLSDLGRSGGELLDGWRSLTLPVGPDPGHAVCVYRRDQQLDPDDDPSQDRERPGEVQRAVFDVSLSRLGRCQVDALCQRSRFDLLVRSEVPLDQGVRKAIVDLFEATCEISGVKGEIGFRLGQFFEAERLATAPKAVTT